ncbi:hypothetical protein DFP85_106110 [Halomonas ventosae]|uniref:Uncharacterized protein n=1 Tax=Halomonas ventosae TaxID=229007 RepID=A0A4R6ZR33_9GAMM|nr:hypothetical protein [Halomonas ventosae]TDR54965.1 hypothetical protein DFP85_106110 [Halomonas ventosae]
MTRVIRSSSDRLAFGLRAWRSWGASLLVVMALLLLFELGQGWLASRSQAPLFRVIVAGEPLTLDAETHAEFSRDLTALAMETEERLQARMRPWLDERLDSAFAPLESAVPDYLDWYYSPVGSYTRLGVALMGDLDDWLDEQLHRRLVEGTGLESALADLQADYPRRLVSEQQALADEMVATLQARYAPQQVAPEREGERRVHELDLDGVLQEALRDGLDTARWSTAAVGGSGASLLAGRALARRFGASAAAQGSRLALRSLVSRLGAGGMRSLAAGGAASAVAAPAGPGALVVGTVATAVSLAGIAGSEYAMLKVQEALHRPAKQTQLIEAIGETRRALRASLEASASAGAATLTGQVEAQATRAEDDEGMPHAYRILGRRGE